LISVGRFRISLEGLGLAVLALALVLSVQRCAGIQEGKQAERLAQLERNAHKATLAGLRQKARVDSVMRATDAERKRVVNLVAANRNLSARLDATLAANDALLSDSSRIAINGRERELFVALQHTTEVARLYRDSTDVLLGGIDRLLAAHETEREAWLAERAAAALELSAERRVSEHLRKQARCRVLGVPCVSRVNAYVGGILTGLLVVSVL
jgi:hypothetical protein